MSTAPFKSAYPAFRQGDLAAAERDCRRALAEREGDVQAWHLLALINVQKPDYAEARKSLEIALALNADDASVWCTYGNVLKQQKEIDGAIAAYDQALSLDPGLVGLFVAKAEMLHSLGRSVEAEEVCRQALSLDSQLPGVHRLLGRIFQVLRRYPEAVENLRQACRLDPDDRLSLLMLSATLAAMKDDPAAEQCLQDALARYPDWCQAWDNLAALHQRQGRVDEARRCYESSISLNKNRAYAYDKLGSLLRTQGKYSEAAACYRRAIALEPDVAAGHNNLASALQPLGELDAAIVHYDRALALKPGNVMAYSNRLFAEQYRPGVMLASLYRLHRDWDRTHELVQVSPLPQAAERPLLRVGFVSPDLREHPVAALILPAFEHLLENDIEIVCYSDCRKSDAVTERFRACAALWRDAAGASTDALVSQVLKDQPDLLIDLAGHTANNRMPVFARKPAPVQASWAGYPGTTGLAAMDYVIADPYLVPPEAEPWYTETIVRLPASAICFAPPPMAPPVGPLPMLAQGLPTFGSFNKVVKLNEPLLRVWGRLLARLPEARLILQNSGFDDPAVRARLTGFCLAGGARPEQLLFRNRVPREALLAAYSEIDIALDTFPYAGGATTCEALWMGVPVITLAGETYAGRQSLSYVTTAGHPEFVAETWSDYEDRAVSLVRDPMRLQDIRGRLREDMAKSPLCDGKQFAKHFAALCRYMAAHPRGRADSSET